MESRKKHLHLPYLVLVLCLGGCDQEDITISSQHPQINFTLAKTNSDDNYVSRVSTAQLSQQLLKWSDHGGEIWLTRELHYEVVLENDEVVTLEIHIRLNEPNKDLLILKEDGKWAFKTPENERARLAQFDGMRIVINQLNVFYCRKACENIRIDEVRRVLYDGRESTYLSFGFHGQATTCYDPSGVYTQLYEFSNGSFSGLVDHVNNSDIL